jgi:glycerol-3-phosphate O-acyltransferase
MTKNYMLPKNEDNGPNEETPAMKNNSNSESNKILHYEKYKGLSEVMNASESAIIKKLVPILSSKVYADKGGMEILKETATKGPVIYALKYRNLYDIHFIRYFLRKNGLPEPNFAFSVPPRFHWSVTKLFNVLKGSFTAAGKGKRSQEDLRSAALKDTLSSGGAATFFLVDEKTARQRYVYPKTDPLETILDVQGRVQASITIVPLFVMYDRRPKRTVKPFWEVFFGDPDRPGPVYRIINSFRKWILPELLVGEPMSLLEHLEEFGGDIEWEDAPAVFRKRLTASINDRIRVSRGPERLSKTELKEKVLRDPKVRIAVKQTVEDEGSSPAKIRAKAESYVDEIAADQRMFMLRFWYTVIYHLIEKLFERVDVRESDFDMVRQESQKGSLIYVPCHKSHFDYLVNLYFLFIRQVMPPLTASGNNLSFWPIGPMLRYTAAFFMRRSFKGLNLYKRVFEAYLKELVQEKYSIQVFIEGGRSRTGKLLDPKLGFLSFLLQTVERGETYDLKFVPLYIGYDHVLEEKSFLRELSGKEKEKENIWGVLKARKVFKAKYGVIYLRFHEPISFRQFCNHWGDVEPENLSPSRSRKVLEAFGYYIMNGIVESTVITSLEITAAGLVCTGKLELSRNMVIESFKFFLDILKFQEAEVDKRTDNVEMAVDRSINVFHGKGLLEKRPDEKGSDIIYTINSQNSASLRFYQNALMNHLWPMSFVATIILSGNRDEVRDKKQLIESFKKLYEINYKEIVNNPLILNEDLFEKTWRYFVSRDWINENGIMQKHGVLCLERLSGITKELMETYHLVLETADDAETGSMSSKDFAKRMKKRASEMRQKDSNGEDHGLIMNSVTIANALLRFRELGALRYKPTNKSYEGVMDRAKFDELKDFLRNITSFQINDLDVRS